MARPFLVSDDDLSEMRDLVRFRKLTYSEAGSRFGYERASAFNAISRYEEIKGLKPTDREERFGGLPIAAATPSHTNASTDAMRSQDSTGEAA